MCGTQIHCGISFDETSDNKAELRNTDKNNDSRPGQGKYEDNLIDGFKIRIDIINHLNKTSTLNNLSKHNVL